MRVVLASLAVIAVSALFAGMAPRFAPPRDDAASISLGWQLGLQAWTFRDRTAFEAIDAAKRLGINVMEFYPGQPLAKDVDGIKLDADLSKEHREALQRKLTEAGVKAVSFGVVTFANDEPAARKVFEFAKAMGMATISCEPKPEAMDLIERLCKEYRIRAAIHNHPKPSQNWNPETVLASLKGRDALMGACADTGHWPRSGLVALECLKKYDGRILELHFKDITDGQDRPWGAGSSDAKAMLAELKRQAFKGTVLVEYELGTGAELEANVAKCVEFFDTTCRGFVAPPGGDGPSSRP